MEYYLYICDMEKTIKGYEGLYSINNQCVIRKIKTGKILSTFKAANGRQTVNLVKDGKRTSHGVRNLHAEAFGSYVRNLSGEVFRQIEDFEGLYAVSNQGRVRRLRNNHVSYLPEKMLKQSTTTNGTKVVTLRCEYGTSVRTVASLVANAFILDISNKRVYHLDNDKSNNRLENLFLKPYYIHLFN